MKMNRILTLLSVAAFTLASCVREDMPATPASGEDSGDRVTFEVGFNIPTNDSPATKVMAEGATIDNIYIAVFGSNNYLNEFVKAIPLDGSDNMNLNGDGSYNYEKIGGVYKVRFSLKPTSSRRTVHILANVPAEMVPPDFGYVDEVMLRNLYCSGTQDGYWQYLNLAGINSGSASAFNGLQLVRNFAKVSLSAAGSGYTVVGFELYDTPTRGSFAPYLNSTTDSETGDITYNFYTGWVTSGGATDYAMVKSAYTGYLMPGAAPLYRPDYDESSFPNNTDPKFMYEHPASEDNPTFIIAKLTKDSDPEPRTPKYYRLDILNKDRSKSAILRNYRYTVSINTINSSGYNTPAEAIEHPSDYNFTLSEETKDAYEISYYGASMQVSYVEKVFLTAQDNVEFKYRYTANLAGSPIEYTPGAVSGISGDADVTAHWGADAAGTGPDGEGWYTVTYNVPNPASLPGEEDHVSTFKVTAGEGNKLIQRVVEIVAMKKKQFTVKEWYQPTNKDLTLTFELPDNLRQSIFPLQFKFETHDIATVNKVQDLTPQTSGLVPVYDKTGAFYFLMNYYWADYEANHQITVNFQSSSDALQPEVILSDLGGYFEELDLGAAFVTGLYAKPIAKGTGHTTVLEFNSSTTDAMTLTLTNLTASNYTSPTGTLSGSGPYTYTPNDKGIQRIVLTSSVTDDEGTVEITRPSPSDALANPGAYTVKRYDKYVTGSISQVNDLPLGMGQSTTISFDYTAWEMMPVTITAPGVTISKPTGTDGYFDDNGDGTYTYTPVSTGTKNFTITSTTNFADPGNISLSVSNANMINPPAHTITRVTTIEIPINALSLVDALHFNAPMYWRTNQTYSTSGTEGSSDYFYADLFGVGSNTGKITIDISNFEKKDDTKVYFMYHYTQRFLIVIPISRYKFANATLLQLLNATAGAPVTLTFTD